MRVFRVRVQCSLGKDQGVHVASAYFLGCFEVSGVPDLLRQRTPLGARSIFESTVYLASFCRSNTKDPAVRVHNLTPLSRRRGRNCVFDAHKQSDMRSSDSRPLRERSDEFSEGTL